MQWAKIDDLILHSSNKIRGVKKRQIFSLFVETIVKHALQSCFLSEVHNGDDIFGSLVCMALD